MSGRAGPSGRSGANVGGCTERRLSTPGFRHGEHVTSCALPRSTSSHQRTLDGPHLDKAVAQADAKERGVGARGKIKGGDLGGEVPLLQVGAVARLPEIKPMVGGERE